MKKKSTSQSAFFNLRVLLGLVLAFGGVIPEPNSKIHAKLKIII